MISTIQTLFRQMSNFQPYEHMSGVTQLVIPVILYEQLIERLQWGISNSLEDGGLVTVRRSGHCVLAVGIYPAPDKFKGLHHVHFSDIHKSEWLEELERNLVSEGEKIGLEYHTHAILVDYPQTEHEEWKTSFRIKPSQSNKKERILGDLIIEMTKAKEICIHGYTPSEAPYLYHQPGEYGKTRQTHSLEILIPELELKYNFSL